MELEVENHCRELMVRSQQGDAKAYRELLDLVSFHLAPFLRKRLPEERVEDVMQEALITLHRIRDTWDSSRAFSPWLYAIATHRIKDSYRHHSRSTRRDDLARELNSHAETTDPQISQFEARADLAWALAQLNERQRTIVSLLKLQELPMSEIAAQLSMSVSAVKVSAHRAYEALRKLLSEKRHAD